VKLPAVDTALMAKWQRIQELRNAVNKEIETLREQGQVGSSLQAEVDLHVPQADFDLLQSLQPDLAFVFITSRCDAHLADSMRIQVTASAHQKCERCWHYQSDVGSHADHPGVCGRCVSNLHGAGEVRHHA